ncbi:MAG: VWA domain-containing protein [Zavarzinella sp.]|nr:VWA domain-containing protein [Zavarzinella sp.]
MAIRPSRPSCAPLLRWGVWLFVFALLGISFGCGRGEDPKVAVTAEQGNQVAAASEDSISLERDANGQPVPVRVSGGVNPPAKEVEAGGKFLDDAKNRFKGRPTLLDPTAPPPPKANGGGAPGGMFGFTGGRGGDFGALGAFGGGIIGNIGGGGGQNQGQNVGQLFQGGQGALGFGGGNVGMAGGGGGALARQLLGPNAAPGFDPDMSGEHYQYFQDNPFKVAQGADALSTISTAVDTASYANVRARINEGQLPSKDAVRIADFVNYFPYDYPAPKNGDPVAFKLELGPCPWQPTHHLLRVGLKAKVIDKDRMPPRNLVFLIDTSGSMDAPNRLPLVQESLKLLTEQLTGRDRVSIVTYAGTAGLLLPPTPGDQKERIVQEVLSLSAGGSTNGEGGIRMAYEQAEKSFLKDGINRVILATDGDFNVGVSDEAELVRLIEEKRKTGVYLTVLGYGMGNLQDATLEQLAHHGNGHYAYIDSLDEARKLFVEQGAALVTVAKDVKVQVEFNPARVAGYRLIGYENRILRNEDFRDDAKDAGDLGSGHTSTALYEVVPVGEKVGSIDAEPLKYQTKPELTGAARTGEWLTVRMRYKHPETEKASEVSSVLPATGLAKEASADFQFAAAVAAFGMVLRDSGFRGDADYDKVMAWAKPAVGKDPGGHRAEFVRLVERAKDVAAKKEEGQK